MDLIIEFILLAIWTTVAVSRFKAVQNKEKISNWDSFGVIAPILCAVITITNIDLASM